LGDNFANFERFTYKFVTFPFAAPGNVNEQYTALVTFV